MKIIFWGTPEFAIPSLNALHESKHEILAVVTQPDKRRSRGKNRLASPIKNRAIELGIKVLTPNCIKKDEDIKKIIKEMNADIFIVVAFGQILPKEILDLPPLGCWNSHGSILPRWRGAAPLQWSLLSGDSHTGIAIMNMEEQLDTGPILLSKTIKIELLDNQFTLSNTLSKLSAELLLESLKLISEKEIQNNMSSRTILDLTSQDRLPGKVTYARMIKKDDLKIIWSEPCITIHRKVMGLYPNAYTVWKHKRLKLYSTEPLDENYNHSIEKELLKYSTKLAVPGEIIAKDNNAGIIIATGGKPILLKEAKLEGKNPLKRKALIQQINPQKGDKFEY